jgi:hypothetical protein
LTAAIRSDAEKRGITEESLRAKITSGAEPKTAGRLIAQSLKEMAIKDKSSEELEVAQQKIDKLEIKVVELEDALKSAKQAAGVSGLSTPKPRGKKPNLIRKT